MLNPTPSRYLVATLPQGLSEAGDFGRMYLNSIGANVQVALDMHNQSLKVPIRPYHLHLETSARRTPQIPRQII